MAKGKKSSGKSYTSKGANSNVKRSVLRDVRAEKRALGEREINKLNAFRAGKRVMITIRNPQNDPSRLFIRVPAETVWKNRSGEGYVMGGA